LSQAPEVEIFHAESGTPFNARLRDLSRGGCYIETDCSLPLETEITITLKKSGDEVKAQARIVRAFPSQGLALAFTSMEGNGFRILDSWLSTFVAITWVSANRRRSQRLAMQIKVRVSGYNTEGTRFVEDTNTVEISAYGGSLILHTPMKRGQRLVLTNLQSKVTVECLVVYHEAKDTAWLLGLAFIAANQSFWPVAFPPADWSHRELETKGSGW
jgi:hypothetical protein